MTREELIGYCRYYKGEEECPFDDTGYSYTFWKLERMYVQHTAGTDSHKAWEADVRRHIERYPQAHDAITAQDVNIHTKGIAVFIFNMLQKWMPYNWGDVFKQY